CRAAMYSPYSALFKQKYWGGIPISLFALGAFAFFAAFAIYLIASGPHASRRSLSFFAGVSLVPLGVSLLMLTISIAQLGSICLLCGGSYSASFRRRRAAGLAAARARHMGDAGRTPSSAALPLIWLAALGGITLAPALVYAASAPDERPYIDQCG